LLLHVCRELRLALLLLALRLALLLLLLLRRHLRLVSHGDSQS
jgi:hypothetical protein